MAFSLWHGDCFPEYCDDDSQLSHAGWRRLGGIPIGVSISTAAPRPQAQAHRRLVKHRPSRTKKLAKAGGWAGAGLAAGRAAGPAGSAAVGAAKYRKDLKAGGQRRTKAVAKIGAPIAAGAVRVRQAAPGLRRWSTGSGSSARFSGSNRASLRARNGYQGWARYNRRSLRTAASGIRHTLENWCTRTKNAHLAELLGGAFCPVFGNPELGPVKRRYGIGGRRGPISPRSTV